MFNGILKCGDCGANMRANIDKGRRGDGSVYRYVGFMCGNYARKGKGACSAHMIYERALTELVLYEIRAGAARVDYDESRVAEYIRQTKSREDDVYLTAFRKEMKAAQARIKEIETVIQTLYEDRVRQVISGEMFKTLSEKYTGELENKAAAIIVLEEKIRQIHHAGFLERGSSQDDHAQIWLKNIRQYINPQVLTQDILLELVDRIEVREGKERVCHVRIVYRFEKAAAQEGLIERA